MPSISHGYHVDKKDLPLRGSQLVEVCAAAKGMATAVAKAAVTILMRDGILSRVIKTKFCEFWMTRMKNKRQFKNE